MIAILQGIRTKFGNQYQKKVVQWCTPECRFNIFVLRMNKTSCRFVSIV